MSKAKINNLSNTKKIKTQKVDLKNPTAYQKYLLSKTIDNNKKKYFDFYNDVKHSSHQIYDW